MSGKTKRRFHRRTAIAASLILPFAALPAFAQQADTTDDSGKGAQQLERTVVTGSNIRRTDTETPSPVQVLTADDLKKSGYTSLADVLHGITANNMGSLTQANPAAFGAGGAGVSLRGLTVGATLVLIDGHRMSAYPMPDDGERSFVDLSSIPFDAIERVEISKDGASAVYGSDAVAGVVNVILRKSFVGTKVNVELGMSYKGDGTTTHASATTGWGDLTDDGYNAYIAMEYRHQDDILLSSRPYLDVTNWTSYGHGGVNLTQGVDNPTVTVGLPGSIYGYLLSIPAAPNTPTIYSNLIHSYGPCTSNQLVEGLCPFVNHGYTIEPQTQNVDLLGRFTKSLEGDWMINFQGSVFNSQATQAGVLNATAPLGFFGITSLKFGPNANPPVPYNANNFPYVITVPANYPGNTSGARAALIYNFPDLGPQQQETNTNSYRFVTELTGEVAGWDTTSAVGFTRVTTELTQLHYLSLSGIQSELNSLQYIVGGNNSQQVLDRIAPTQYSTSTSDLDFINLSATRDLMKLQGGPLSIAVGFDFTHRALDEQFPGSFADGDQASPIYSFAVGDQNTTSLYSELSAPILKSLELDAAARYDKYSDFSNVSPKLGFKFTPLPELTFRGTYAQGFRAPNVAESGNAGSTSGVLSAATNPATGNLIFVPNIQLSNPNLRPEKSDSYTLGFIAEPSRQFNLSVDYYHIEIKDQIISVGQLGEAQYLFPQLLGVKFYPNLANIAYDTYPFINADSTITNGVDVDLRGKFNLAEYGKLGLEFELTRMFKYQLTLPTLGTYQLAGTHGPSFISGDTGTPQNRATFTTTWDRGPFELSASVNYVSGYTLTDLSYGIPDCATALVDLFNGNPPPKQLCSVPSFTTVNLNTRYDLSKHWTLHASIVNLFNRNAPFDLQTFGSAGNGAGVGGAPYNPALAQDGAVGRFFSVGASYTF